MRAHSPSRQDPLITVAVPAYNHQRFVEQALTSVLGQEGVRVEIVAIDDGSKDGTFAILQRLASEHSQQLTVRTRPNRGVCATMNECVRAGTAPYVAVLASDDYMLPGRLQAQAVLLAANPQVGIVHSSVIRVDEAGREIPGGAGDYVPAQGNPFEDFLFGRVGVCAPSVMFRREVFDSVGGFDESYPIEDWPFLMRAARRGFQFAFIDKPLTAWRLTSGSAGHSTAKNWRAALAIWEGELAFVDADTARRARRRFFRYELQSALYQRDHATALELAAHFAELRGPGFSRWAAQTGARLAAQRLLPQALATRLKAVLRRSAP